MATATLSSWVSTGRADIQARKNSMAYAQFARRCNELIAEHCGPDPNREFNRAPLDISEPTCECGNDKMLMLDGTLGDQCQNCQQIDEQGRHRRRCKRRCQRPCLRTPRHRQDPRPLRPGPPPPSGGSWPLRPLRSGLPPGAGTACWLAKRGLDLLRRLRSGQPWNPPAFRLDQPTTAHRRTLRAPVVRHHV